LRALKKLDVGAGGKNLMLKLILGGAALQRSGNCIIVNAALAAEAT
jgi:hypothetical protein